MSGIDLTNLLESDFIRRNEFLVHFPPQIGIQEHWVESFQEENKGTILIGVAEQLLKDGKYLSEVIQEIFNEGEFQLEFWPLTEESISRRDVIYTCTFTEVIPPRYTYDGGPKALVFYIKLHFTDKVIKLRFPLETNKAHIIQTSYDYPPNYQTPNI